MFRRARLKNADDIARIREACLIINSIFLKIHSLDLQGITSDEIDTFIESEILKNRGRPAFKTVRGYGYASCISINNEVVHGIPSKKKKFQPGDLIKIDTGVALNGYFGDSCFTFTAGTLSEEAARLRSAAYDALQLALDAVKPGGRVGDIGSAVSALCAERGYSPVTRFSGHGVGFALHEPPSVPNAGRRGTGARLEPGMVLAVEPMINQGGADVVICDDGWTAVTADGTLSAQFEHTIAVTESGCETLTDFTGITGGL
jgi:methionyl aminopeptidase